MALLLDILIGVAGLLAAILMKLLMMDLSPLCSRQDSNLHVPRS